MSRGTCVACDRAIDDSAKLCPFCGANPMTGERVVDTQAVLQEVFQPRETSTSATVLEYARQRQGAVIAITAFVAFLVIAALHQFVTMRNATAVSDAPAVPLSEITDVTRKADDAAAPVPMPELNFQFEGRAEAMRTYIVEPGAITPPEVVAAQAAARQQAAAAQRATPTPQNPAALRQPPQQKAAPAPRRPNQPVPQSRPAAPDPRRP